ncbi:MAG TPA: V-type ATPase subunit [Sphaerochaeta sp.]|nr:V-type ATPase subunit [Sphaerochaeta sp.]
MRQNPTSLYGFINAKLRARIGLMRESHMIEDLLKAKGVVEAVAILRDSAQSSVATAYDRTGDIQQMELALLYNEVEMYQEVAKYLEGKPADFVLNLLGKIEVDNLKNTIRLWYGSIIRRRPMRFRSEYLFKGKLLNDIDWTALVNATSWDGVCKALANTPYSEVAHAFNEQQLDNEGLFMLENMLDLQWYEQMMGSTEKLSSQDKRVAQSVFLVDIDLKNLLMMVRYGWYHKMDKEKLQALLLPWGKVYKNKSILNFIQSSPQERDPFAVIEQLYPGLNQAIQQISEEKRGSVHQDELMALQNLRIEAYLHERRKTVYRKILASDPFTIGVSLAYFFLYKEEDTMIKAILNGKYYGYEEDYIRGVLA